MATIPRNAPASHASPSTTAGVATTRTRPIVVAGVYLGLGLGGFFDGIVLHQILQWHHLISSVAPATDVAGLQLNTLADGLFHAATWVLTVVGLALLWRASRMLGVVWSTRAFVGALLVGWGSFNLVEGLINHQLLALHHVRPGPNEFAWDMGFLAWGALMLIAGWILVRRGAVAARMDA